MADKPKIYSHTKNQGGVKKAIAARDAKAKPASTDAKQEASE